MESKIKTGDHNKNVVFWKEARERAAGYDRARLANRWEGNGRHCHTDIFWRFRGLLNKSVRRQGPRERIGKDESETSEGEYRSLQPTGGTL